MLAIYSWWEDAYVNSPTEVSNICSPKIKSILLSLLYHCEVGGHLYFEQIESSYGDHMGSQQHANNGNSVSGTWEYQ